MRKIDPRRFQIAKRRTSREINRQIALTLIRTHQPVSRADLARLMGTRRGAASVLVNELLAEGLIFEGATGEGRGRGRKPTFLYIDSRERYVIAVDIRATRTYMMATDLMGKQLVGISHFPTHHDLKDLIEDLARRIKSILADHSAVACQGVGVVVPGMTDPSSGKVVHAPTLGWRDVNLKDPLSALVDLPVHVENSGRACALAQVWATRGGGHAGDLAFVSVSDGVGVGIVVNGEILRGRHNIAGEFGHVPLNIDGPRCSCGATGCWESYISNLATLSRYFGRTANESKPMSVENSSFTIEDLIARARNGDAKALTALHSTGRYLGLGLASIINSLDPGRVYIGGEIIAAWDLIESSVRAALTERALTDLTARTDIRTVSIEEHPRLRGAAALVAAPAFAAPKVA
ncbi:MAG TPA: ROK family transcriptional regulator [Pyrinomonadaceae bacterium]|nr:ROK family transcriptional regulator [Pyrinomonadaceae bacterium]